MTEQRRTYEQYQNLPDALLVSAIRMGDEAAAREFIRRFAHELLRQARLLRVPDAEADEIINDTFADVIMWLGEHRQAVPRSMVAYVVTSFRNRVFNLRRAERRRASAEAVAAEASDAAFDGAVPSVCSEASLRSSVDPFAEVPRLPFALETLLSAIDESTSVEERMILGWLGSYRTHSEIASWLGTSYDATDKRIQRLRRRLLDAAERYSASLTEDDRKELEPFFRRSEAMLRRRRQAARDFSRDVRSESA